MAIAFVQSPATSFVGNQLTQALAFGSNVTAGSLLLATVRFKYAGGIPTVTITDNVTAGNWTQIGTTQIASGALAAVAVFYRYNAVGGARTVTANYSNTNAGSQNFDIAEFSGAATATDPLGQAAQAAGTASAVSTAAVASTAASMVAIAVPYDNAAAIVLTGGWTAWNGAGAQPCYQLVAASGTPLAAIATGGAHWAAALAFFGPPIVPVLGVPFYEDRAAETSTTTGTGSYALGGALGGYTTFASAFPLGTTVYYVAADGANFESGLGLLTGATTLARSTIFRSSNAGAAVNWSAGTRVVMCSVNAHTLSDTMNLESTGFRLTLTSGVPVTVADATSTTLFLSPWTSNRLAIYSPTTGRWTMTPSSEVSLALGTLVSGTIYDVFVFNNAGALTMDPPLAWASASARATAIVQQDGVWCKSGDLSRRWVGSFRAISATQATDTAAQRFLFNAANRVRRVLSRQPGVDSWTYPNPGGVFRQANATAANRVEVLVGLAGWSTMDLKLACTVSNATSGQSVTQAIGEDSTTAIDPLCILSDFFAYAAGGIGTATCSLTKMPSLGYHAYNWLESGNLTGTVTTFGTRAAAANGVAIQSGLGGCIEA